jgi:hypothetical protein
MQERELFHLLKCLMDFNSKRWVNDLSVLECYKKAKDTISITLWIRTLRGALIWEGVRK